MKFAIFGNTYQAKKFIACRKSFHLLAQHQAQLCVCREFYNFLTSDLHLNIPPAELFDGDASAPIWLSASAVTARF